MITGARHVMDACLPVAPPPMADERLSSWLARLAKLYGVTIGGLLEHFGLREINVGSDFLGDLDWRLGAAEAAAIAAATGRIPPALRAMTFAELRPRARALIARRGRRVCPVCAGDPMVARKSAALPWVFWCPLHGARMRPLTGATLPDIFSEAVLARLDPFARRAAARLNAWASEGEEDHAPDLPNIVALLDFLTAPYRRPSSPTLAEIPGVTRVERHMFREALNRLIPRQALAIVVPEYDRAAPVFTKAAPPGLAALARGSLLQTYALAVGLGRLIEEPVTEVVKTLLASDSEGEARLREVLRSWPAPLRHRITREKRRVAAASRPLGAPRAAQPGRHGPPDAERDDFWRRLATEVVADNMERLKGLETETKLGALMRLAEERRNATLSDPNLARGPGSVSTIPTQSHELRFGQSHNCAPPVS
ncbi:MAG: TniQ family protein [Methylocystis sp.]